jgi:NitT/TauT family transport system ATP-binding protein
VTEQSVLEFQKVDLTFAEHGMNVLSDVSFSVREGNVLSIIGPSGCGKSTVLNLAAGLLGPSAGNVVFRGVPLKAVNTNAAYVTQDANLLPWLNVSANIGLALKLRGVPKSERTSQVKEWIERVGLTGFEKHFPSELSGGMQKRCSIARALIYQPSIVLMDEPFGPLDAITRVRLQQELLDLFGSSRQTVIFVTHDLNEAVSLGDTVIVMSRGPGKIIGTIEVGIEGPRSIAELSNSQDYQDKCQQLREFFHGELGGK